MKKRLLPLLLLAALASTQAQQSNALAAHAAGSQSAVAPTEHKPNFADDEVVAGSGNTWTLKHAPSPANSLVLVFDMPGWGGVPLLQRTGYSIQGNKITTTEPHAKGALHAWYRW